VDNWKTLVIGLQGLEKRNTSLASQTQPTPVQIAFSITHGEGSGDAR